MKAQKKYLFNPDYAIAPGNTLHEVMESLNMTQKELAKRLEMAELSLIRIFAGTQPISYETANRLEMVTAVPARFWNNLEAEYREQLAKIQERERLEAEIAWLKSIPVKELIERDCLPQEDEEVEQLRSTLQFFGVASVDAWNQVWEAPKVAARRSKCFESRAGDAAAWVRQGELQAQDIECEPFDRNRFKENLVAIRELTREDPETFLPEMKRLCAESGVAISLVKEMKKVPWNGATKWLSPNKVMILLSLRGRGEDRFWFSFFHEAGHVLHDNKKDLLIDDGTREDPRELRADKFAADLLIPKKFDAAITRIRTKAEIIDLANTLSIAPGIVAGRYQFLTQKWKTFRGLIRSFEWTE
ncbi:ImmA/IrrE family metallo-endopeptidase [uncultured Desulfuromonas sp.]|uniref:ImmA/IrrE family metallo-endopeptidase n=1 Tax=uncultured Desulfuromonas sp. TaxID=181013 RepID=UPI002AAB8F9E|nr:ImmA/IrrE family metallo-endopeptidase [uncultured Desulfuromonas sp.]